MLDSILSVVEVVEEVMCKRVVYYVGEEVYRCVKEVLRGIFKSEFEWWFLNEDLI